jgi:hypothetical protein
MLVKRRRIELSKDKNLAYLRIEAIADRNVDEAVFACQGNGWLASILGERVQALALSPAQNDPHYVWHVSHPIRSLPTVPTKASKRKLYEL